VIYAKSGPLVLLKMNSLFKIICINASLLSKALMLKSSITDVTLAAKNSIIMKCLIRKLTLTNIYDISIIIRYTVLEVMLIITLFYCV
jgi:hypothetical protein